MCDRTGGFMSPEEQLPEEPKTESIRLNPGATLLDMALDHVREVLQANITYPEEVNVSAFMHIRDALATMSIQLKQRTDALIQVNTALAALLRGSQGQIRIPKVLIDSLDPQDGINLSTDPTGVTITLLPKNPVSPLLVPKKQLIVPNGGRIRK